MPQYGTGSAWTFASTRVTISNADWTTYALDAKWAAAGYMLDVATTRLLGAGTEAQRVQQVWENYAPRVILPSLQASDFALAGHMGQMLASMAASMTQGHPGFREHLPGFIDEQTTPALVRAGVFGMNLAEARAALVTTQPFLTVQDLQQSPTLCCQAAVAYLKTKASTHNWDPLQAVALMERGTLKTVSGTQTPWQLDCKTWGAGVYDTSLTRMVAQFNMAEQFTRFRS